MVVKKLIILALIAVKKAVLFCVLTLYLFWLKTRWFFFRRTFLTRVLIVGVIFLGVSITIQHLKELPCPEYMSWPQCISEQVFKYLYDWAIILSASLLLAIIVISWLAMVESKRSRDKIVVSDWCNTILNIITEIFSAETTRKTKQIWNRNRIKLAEGHIIAGVSASNLGVDTMLKMNDVLKKIENVRKNIVKGNLKRVKYWCEKTVLELMNLLRLVS